MNLNLKLIFDGLAFLNNPYFTENINHITRAKNLICTRL
jgi:hypothetical protein